MAVHERSACRAGDLLIGPCILEEPGATSYIPDGWQAAVDHGGSVVIDRESSEATSL